MGPLRRMPGGNTPTGVGKTPSLCRTLDAKEKHPHGCGEDLKRLATLRRRLETPPRVWGRLIVK